jgi:hypothetical protein
LLATSESWLEDFEAELFFLVVVMTIKSILRTGYAPRA